ncbi:MAG: hypothetical protein R3C44_20475 [Chloroflexota bacterium]
MLHLVQVEPITPPLVTGNDDGYNAYLWPDGRHENTLAGTQRPGIFMMQPALPRPRSCIRWIRWLPMA